MGKKFTSNPLVPHDLGLSYEEAAHGVQTAIRFKIENNLDQASTPKHLRVGIDMSKSDMAALVSLLLERNIFTLEQYLEALRVQANEELYSHEQEVRLLTGNPNLSCR